MLPRRVFAFLLLLGLLAAAGCASPSGGAAGTYEVRIEGPGDAPYWNGTVTVSANAATVLGTLEAAAAVGGFTLDVEVTGLGAYVRAIGPHQEDLASGHGWCFLVDGGDGYQDVRAAADARVLHSGERILWRYGSGSEC